MNDPRGSIWRKWDLHLHTPASFDYQDKSVSNEKIIETLLENKIAAVAITDHHFIDVERVQYKKVTTRKKCIISKKVLDSGQQHV